ncbi:MAG: response regulator, partial [Chloroflexota bacterium]|nr:response regulator transcription factor [Anaerolineales bacterium]
MKADLITILIADDHPIVRAGIRTILEAASDLRVIGEAEDGDAAQKLVAELQPRVLLLDLKMPGLSSAQVEKWVRSNFPDIVTLVLTAHDRDVYLSQMLEAGVSGYMDKNTRGEQLIAAIRRAVNGEMLFSGEQIQRALQWRRQEGTKWQRLTVREREVLQHLANGLDNAGISLRLNISQKTVAFHITNILKKLE